MAVNIELHSYSSRKTEESDSEEYQEIKQESLITSPLASPVKEIKDFDFFTKCNTRKNKVQRKKKNKKRDTSRNVMDIIHSELATTPFLEQNVITSTDKSLQNISYLINTSSRMSDQGNRGVLESEKSSKWHRCVVKLCPIFTTVLENSVRKYTTVDSVYVEPVMFSDIIAENISNDLTLSPKFLDIMIQNLKFVSHHNFSLEMLLCVKLVDLYEKYKILLRTINEYHRSIVINRKTRDDVKNHLLSISPSKKENVRFDSTVLKYTKDMLDLKEKYYQGFEDKRVIIHQLTTLWADIKKVRDELGPRTAYILDVTKKELQQVETEKQWTQIYEEEFSDMLIKIEYDFITKYIEYKEAKLNIIAKDKNNIVKPKLKINEDDLKEKVDSIVSGILSKNNIDFMLKEDIKLSKKVRENKEQQDIYNYFFRIYVDDVFVCETEKYVCADLREIQLAETFCIQILPNNSIVKIAMFENFNELSVLNVPISGIKKKSSEVQYVSENFIYNEFINPSSNFIGSGCDIKDIASASKVRLKSSNIFKGNIVTNCKVDIKMGWNDKLGSNANEAIQESFQLRTELNRLLSGTSKPTVSSIMKLINIIFDKDIDEDANISNAVGNVCNNRIKPDLDWNTRENAKDLQRFQLINLRNKGQLIDVENQAIALNACQISTEQINSLKIDNKDVILNYFQDNDEINQIDLKRYLGAKFVMTLNKNLTTKLEKFLLKKSYKDVVNDYQLLNLRNFFTNQLTLNMIVTQSVSKQQLVKENLKQNREIRVTVLRGHNLFDKMTNLLIDEDQVHENIAGYKVRPLRPFVRVSYRRESAQTPTAMGCYPTWNHTMKIKTKLDPLSSIHINVYDECRMNITEQPTSNTVTYRKQFVWLGAVHVPLRTVLDFGTIRGTFKINTPPFIFGYGSLASNEGDFLDPDVNRLIRKDISFIALSITTDLSHLCGQAYNLPVEHNDTDASIIKHLNSFIIEYLNDFPTRNISLTSIDTTGFNKCVMEFLQPLQPPDFEVFPKDPKKIESAMSKSSGLSKSSSRSSKKRDTESTSSGIESWKTEEKRTKWMDFILRYVSLIPTYELTETHVVTLTGAELLRVLYGSPMDHSILLASYFIYLGLNCYVIVGFGLPRGLSSYVLMSYEDSSANQTGRGCWAKASGSKWLVYDAVAGEKYELREAACPLKNVSYVFNCENIWVNVQSSTECENVSFDFSKSSDWQSVFNKPVFLAKPLLSEGVYNKSCNVESLRDTLETKIKNKVQKWRSHVKTVWNRYCGNLLHETLPHWEYWAANPGHRPSPGHRLKQMMLTYKMFGSPLNMPYLNSKLITSSLKYTGVHANEDPNVEFGLAVEVFTYPNDILSVWVYLVSIIKIGD